MTNFDGSGVFWCSVVCVGCNLAHAHFGEKKCCWPNSEMWPMHEAELHCKKSTPKTGPGLPLRSRITAFNILQKGQGPNISLSFISNYIFYAWTITKARICFPNHDRKHLIIRLYNISWVSKMSRRKDISPSFRTEKVGTNLQNCPNFCTVLDDGRYIAQYT